MLPVIALVGRPNVGKSTLFNRLTRTRDALVADQPGLTRDRQYGIGRLGQFPYVVIDTGGLSGEEQGVEPLMEKQVWQAIEEADHVLFMVDAKQGRNAADEAIGVRLRKSGKPVTLVVNKSENLEPDMAGIDFFGLGGEPVAISAAHGRGVHCLIDAILSQFPPPEMEDESSEGIRVAVIGRPNVGKSTLINRILGEERVIAFDMPGTTRDSIEIPFEQNGQKYILIDTAGVRRRSRIDETIEKFSVIKTLQAISLCHVAILLVDARDGVTEQDAHLAGHLLESGRALLVVVNKWDGLDQDAKKHIKEELQRKLHFLDFASWHYVSALHGSGIGNLLKPIQHSYANAIRDFKTSRLTEIMEYIVTEHQPPTRHGRRIKLRYAHQGGKNPPRIIVHGNQTDALPASYARYVSGRFHKALQLQGTPLVVEFKTGDNPFKNRKNKLTSQQQKRQRTVKQVGRKGN